MSDTATDRRADERTTTSDPVRHLACPIVQTAPRLCGLPRSNKRTGSGPQCVVCFDLAALPCPGCGFHHGVPPA